MSNKHGRPRIIQLEYRELSQLAREVDTALELLPEEGAKKLRAQLQKTAKHLKKLQGLEHPLPEIMD